MDFQAIVTARTSHPEMDDAAFLLWANTPALTSTRDDIPRSEFLYYMYSQGLYARIVGAQMSSNPQIAGLAVTAIAYLGSPDFNVVKWSDPIMQQALGGFVAAGVFAQADVDAAHTALCETWAALFPGLIADDLSAAQVFVGKAAVRQQFADIYNRGAAFIDASVTVPTLDDVLAAGRR